MSALGHDCGTVLPSAWQQGDDGSWWAADEHGIARLVAVFHPLTDFHADVQPRSVPSATPQQLGA